MQPGGEQQGGLSDCRTRQGSDWCGQLGLAAMGKEGKPSELPYTTHLRRKTKEVFIKRKENKKTISCHNGVLRGLSGSLSRDSRGGEALPSPMSFHPGGR